MYSIDGGMTRLRLRLNRTWLLLGAILAAGFGVRLGYVLMAVRTPGFRWEDPDGYLANALLLARPDGWHWSFDVAKYFAHGQQFVLPPLYSIFLSWVALLPGLPLSALLAQSVLSTIAIGLVFALGRTLHSSTTGLWASGAYAASASSIFNVWSTSQETLYIPLVLLAFALYARALPRDPASDDSRFRVRDSMKFAIAGAALGLAALTRSMPLFFLAPFLILHVVTASDRRRGVEQSLAYLAGFAIVVVPYCVGLSRSVGQVIVIDSHSGVRVNAGGTTQPMPGHWDTAKALWQMIADNPKGFVENCAARARALLYVNGGRQLQIYVVAGNKATATLWKILVHIGTDAVLITAVILACFGAVLCRNTRLALAFILWAAVNTAIASMSGFGGARLRTPFEPLLLVLGAVVLAGEWQSRPRAVMALSTALAVMLAAVVVPQLPRSLRSWPDYGVQWPSVLNRDSGTIHGGGAFNVRAHGGVASFWIEPVDPDDAVQVDVRAGGVLVRSARLDHAAASISWPWTPQGLAFAEVRAVDAQTQTPADVRVDVRPR